METTSEPLPDKLWWGALVLTEEKIKYLWEQMQRFPIVFDDFSKGNYENFLSKFFVPSNVFIDIGPNLGLAAGFATKPGLDSVLHLVMFDRRLRGREETFKEIMGYFFDKLKLRRMTAMIADDAIFAKRLVMRLGFKEEGCMRKSILRDGEFKDTYVYGILREEMNGTLSQTQSTRPTSGDAIEGGES